MIPIGARLRLKLAFGIAAALLLVLLIHDRNHWKAKTEHYAEMLAGERAAHAVTVANIRLATEQARLADAANAARARAEQAAITERTSNEFKTRIDAARAADERLRPSAGAAIRRGSRGGASMPGLSTAAQQLAQAPVENRLSQSERLIATEQAIQLDELVKWVRAQSAVTASKD